MDQASKTRMKQSRAWHESCLNEAQLISIQLVVVENLVENVKKSVFPPKKRVFHEKYANFAQSVTFQRYTMESSALRRSKEQPLLRLGVSSKIKIHAKKVMFGRAQNPRRSTKYLILC